MPLDATSPIKPVAAAPTPSRRNGGRQRDQQDLNHLLGFTLPPRAPPPPTHLPRRSNRRNPNYVAFDRSRFVHQFRFIVRPDRDYTAHFADPDIHLDWSDILQVILPTSASALSSVTTAKLDQGTDGASAGGGIPACPICLSEPTAARMTKCGHVFCYPCVLHYLALADNGAKSRNCPVCHDSIHAKDLKSVKWFDPTSSSGLPPPPPSLTQPLADMDDDLARALELSKLDAHPHASTSNPQSSASSRGEKLKMRLIRRPQMTTLALPRSATWPSDAVPPLRAPWQFTPDAFTYAKFMLGAPDYMRDELLAQKAELEREILTLRRFGRRGGTDEELGIVFVDAALRKVDEQLAKAEALKTTSVMTARKRSLREIQQVQEVKGKADEASKLPSVTDTSSSEVEHEGEARPAPALPAPVPVYDPVPLDFLQSRGTTPLSTAAPVFVPSSPPSSRSSVPPPVPLSPPRNRPHQRRNVLAPPPPEEDPAYYFYQAATGQPIFLQPLDIRILKSHFGTYQSMPNEIEVVVEGADEGSMNDELRRRCKWLSHLPIASDVVFVEADLGALVPRKALEPYATALKQRRNKRRNKARKEDRAKAESELKAAEQMPVFESTYAFGASIVPASASSWDDVSAFPAPPLASSPPLPSQPARPPPTPSSWSRPSFASALHASSRSSPSWSHASHAAHDDDFDDRWDEFEERLGRQRASTPRTHSSGNINVGEGGGQAKSAGGGGRGKKGKKVTLHLSGAALRGTG